MQMQNCPPPPQAQGYGYPPYCFPSPGPGPVPVYGSTYNSGNNVNGSGIQKNGDVKVGNSKAKSGGVDIGTIGGNHTNQGGQQSSGNVTLGNIGC
ncbi:hypothetical protein SOVF_144360 [Spinacia oleracea]|nr:hypothetical protein SOVF_144360 [Spinacia oleracea]